MASPRELALLILTDRDRQRAYLNIAYQNRLRDAGLSRSDAAFVKELTYGVVSREITLDAVLAHFSTVRLKKLSVFIRNILRLSLYQMRYLDRIPARAAINEGVRLAKRYGHSASAGYVNAVLRACDRGGDFEPTGATVAETLSLRHSYPLWLVEKWLALFGPERTEALLRAGNERPPLTLRCNTLRTDRASLIERLTAEGFAAEPSPTAPDGVTVSGGNPEASGAYRDGWFAVQDASSQLPARALAPRPGDVTLDLCAAPGGKTTQLAALMQNTGRLVACDLYPERLKLARRLADRLGVTNLETRALDASVVHPELAGIADKALLDVPCSGLGILRRKPDVKYNVTPEAIDGIIRTQRAILEASAGYVKPGGELVYSTCSVNPDENEGVTDAFLAAHPEYAPCPFPGCPEGRMTIFPEPAGGDGFYVCKLKRVETLASARPDAYR